jgi:GNAT superfamily N-acetyltransferase
MSGTAQMTKTSDKDSKVGDPPCEDPPSLRREVDRLNRELRAFVSVALQHGLRDYCVSRHPTITAELEQSHINSQLGAQQKYDQVLSKISSVPGLYGATGETARRTYYRNEHDNVAYVEHALENKRFLLGGIWVTPRYRGNGYAHSILRVLVKAADEADLSIELYHEPFGEEGLSVEDLEAFYNRHGFTKHLTAPGGMVRLPQTPLDLYRKN